MEYWRVCTPCNKHFGFERSYIRHLKYSSAHTQTRCYACSICGQLFLRDDVRKRHELKGRCHSHPRSPGLQQNVPAKRDYVEIEIEGDEEDANPVRTKTLCRPVATGIGSSTHEHESKELHPLLGELNNEDCDELNELARLVDDFNNFGEVSVAGSRRMEIEGFTAPSSTADRYVVDWDMDILHDSARQIEISGSPENEPLYPTDVPELSRGSSAASRHSTSDLDETDDAAANIFFHLQRDDIFGINTEGALNASDTPKSNIRLNKAATRCTICKRDYERDVNDLRKHFYQHLEELKQNRHACEVCDIGFAHKRDLDYHLRAAGNGTCGFSFIHAAACTGHHPPQEKNEDVDINDHDRCRFGLLLREWEQSQLHLHQSSVQHVIKLSDLSRGLSLLSTRSSPLRQSIISLVYSLKSFTSEHHDTNQNAKLNEIDKGLARLHVGKVGSLFRKKLKPREAMREAAERGDFAAVESLLGQGGDILLHAAVRQDSDLIVKELLKAGVHPDCRVDLALAEPDLPLTLRGAVQPSLLFKTTPLIRAAAVGSHAAAMVLIAAGADINIIEIDGTTALGAAIASSRGGIVDILSERIQ